MPSKKLALPDQEIDTLIRQIRGQKVILDSDLAMLYGVEARSLNQAVARNRKRFPADFLFQLSVDEYESIRSQIVPAGGEAQLITNCDEFTEASRASISPLCLH